MDVLARISTYRIQVLRHDSDAEISDACMGDVVDNIYKYVHLLGMNTTAGQYWGQQRTPLRSP